MKKFSKILILAGMAMLIFYGCKKDSGLKTTSPTTKVFNTNSIPDSMMATPFGLMLKTSVHLIESGYHVEVRDGHMFKIKTATGETKADFGAITAANTTQLAATGQSRMVQPSVNASNRIIQPNQNGWKTYAEWHSTSSMNSLSSVWTVPWLQTIQAKQFLLEMV